MRRYIAALALALAAIAVMSAPTFAQSYNPGVGSGNIVPGPKGGFQSGGGSPQLYNYAPLSGTHHYRTGRARRR
jgi:hypothetical protein